MFLITEEAINSVAKQINERNSKNYSIPIIGDETNSEIPHFFEILNFEEIDKTERRFYAIDGSYNSHQFYNGLAVGIYSAGYVCYHEGKELRMNKNTDPVILGKSYYPNNILILNQNDLNEIYDELLMLEPVKKLIDFFQVKPEEIFSYNRDAVCSSLSTLLSFSQEILEWSLVLEIADLEETKNGDFILRDGSLRSLQIKQEFLVKLGEYLHSKGIVIVGITKNSPIKMELSYTYKQIDDYLQDQLKPKFCFSIDDVKRQKLCCWFEVPDSVLLASYGGDRGSAMYAKKDIKGGRGFGFFSTARLDYVEKLQNYDWVIVDLNIFDAMPNIKIKNPNRDLDKLKVIFKELTRLTQEHYILGYPYPLVEAHNFVTLKKDFKEEIIKRVKSALYSEQRLDNVDIENLFLDIHDKF